MCRTPIENGIRSRSFRCRIDARSPNTVRANRADLAIIAGYCCRSLPLASPTMTEIIDPPADLDAVRRSYDAVADNYVSMNMGALAPTPWLRAALDAFAERVRGIGPVLDAGCGPGTTSGYLHALGLVVFGIDLSPRMIEHARKLHPQVPFEVASVTELALGAESLGGVLGWWS